MREDVLFGKSPSRPGRGSHVTGPDWRKRRLARRVMGSCWRWFLGALSPAKVRDAFALHLGGLGPIGGLPAAMRLPWHCSSRRHSRRGKVVQA